MLVARDTNPVNYIFLHKYWMCMNKHLLTSLLLIFATCLCCSGDQKSVIGNVTNEPSFEAGGTGYSQAVDSSDINLSVKLTLSSWPFECQCAAFVGEFSRPCQKQANKLNPPAVLPPLLNFHFSARRGFQTQLSPSLCTMNFILPGDSL